MFQSVVFDINWLMYLPISPITVHTKLLLLLYIIVLVGVPKIFIGIKVGTYVSSICLFSYSLPSINMTSIDDVNIIMAMDRLAWGI